jgi:hypothetical protein
MSRRRRDRVAAVPWREWASRVDRCLDSPHDGDLRRSVASWRVTFGGDPGDVAVFRQSGAVKLTARLKVSLERVHDTQLGKAAEVAVVRAELGAVLHRQRCENRVSHQGPAALRVRH